MSIVRYTNKKTGVVTLYESTSYYDPETKQSRPRRKYLGIEDPETGELIPSTGKRGRKKKDGSGPERKEAQDSKLKLRLEKLQYECCEKDEKIRKLEHDNKRLRYAMKKLADTVDDIMKSLD